MKRLIKRIPVVGPLAARIYRLLGRRGGSMSGPFTTSRDYWETRYASGGNSGMGSYAELAAFKAEVLNNFVKRNDVGSVIELGCGDGNQLSLAAYPRYRGFDVSKSAVEMCRSRFAGDSTKSFALMDEYASDTADLTISLDVVYHLVEDDVFDRYMTTLFGAASRFVIVYSNDTDSDAVVDHEAECAGAYMKPRQFSRWIAGNAAGWKLMERIPNRYPFDLQTRRGSICDFFVYARG